MKLMANITQLARIFGSDRATITKRLGDEPFQLDGTSKVYDLEVVSKLLRVAQQTEDINKLLLDEQLRYETARADKMILEVALKRSEVVPTDEVARIVAAEYTNVRARLLSIPSRCAKDLSLESNPSLVKARLEEEVNEALSELTADIKYEETIYNGEQPEVPSAQNAPESLEGPAKA